MWRITIYHRTILVLWRTENFVTEPLDPSGRVHTGSWCGTIHAVPWYGFVHVFVQVQFPRSAHACTVHHVSSCRWIRACPHVDIQFVHILFSYLLTFEITIGPHVIFLFAHLALVHMLFFIFPRVSLQMYTCHFLICHVLVYQWSIVPFLFADVSTYHWSMCHFLICPCVRVQLVHVLFSYLSTHQITIVTCHFLICPHVSLQMDHVSFSYLSTWWFTIGPHVIMLFVHMLDYNWSTCHFIIYPRACIQLVHDSLSYLSTCQIGPVSLRLDMRWWILWW